MAGFHCMENLKQRWPVSFMIIVRFITLDVSVKQLVINSVMIQNCTKQNVFNILL